MNAKTGEPGSADPVDHLTADSGTAEAAGRIARAADGSAGLVSGSEGIGTAGGTGTPGTAGGLSSIAAGPGATEPHTDNLKAEQEQGIVSGEDGMDAKAGARTTITAGGMDVTGGNDTSRTTKP